MGTFDLSGRIALITGSRPDRSDHRFEPRHRTGEAQASFREEYGADQVFARTFDVTDELDVIEAVNWWVARSLAA
jgi:hypothetical protein